MHKVLFRAGALLLLAACNTTSSKIPFSKEEYQVKNESVLYVYRERAFVGGGVETVIYFDGISVGLLPQKAYYPVHTTAGRHTLKICSGNVVASEQCHELPLDLGAHEHLAVTLVMHAGNDFHFEKNNDLLKLADLKNEGNFYDAGIRSAMPERNTRVALTAASLGNDSGAKGPLKLAILDFQDQTNTNFYGWLGSSLPDAIDQSMRKNFEYKRSTGEAGANLVISGHYQMKGNNTVHIEAQIYFADTQKMLGNESVDAPTDSGLFNSTKILSDRMVEKFRQIVRKP
jgi:hypothetical protein